MTMIAAIMETMDGATNSLSPELDHCSTWRLDCSVVVHQVIHIMVDRIKAVGLEIEIYDSSPLVLPCLLLLHCWLGAWGVLRNSRGG